ncbi:binding-protein-dependent transport systems inner membrane component [Beutenbergia cavernae DSM 12333]|uniref:Binding-protein-dependent transport systems inner membrane component n=1 Tax=Beutenbergia cavernae (strain ATCC BAA-8 / DSM 12333 / CCUG 43141 / JCM 11478 / NBRC 16432 / NCIMB 13614 / HKI 0122) TaxID=471853 RepID=C5BXJ0_BEUC1|nr:carbohydrate ABC transporter permease [Beutenbergia cavernae]ACQ80873.1 binding-protein-dependent transport systems inner membrane component [Beutenbergia cavernae DSM 12333]
MTADAVTTADAAPVRATPPGARKKQSAVSRVLGNTVVNVVLVIVALFWMIPTIGLFIASLRTSTANTSSGWWTVFTAPAQLTIENYANLLQNSTMVASFWNSVAITVPTTILVVVIGALAGYALAWVDFRGRDVVLVVIIALLAVPLQVAFIPLARMFGQLGVFGSIGGVIAFHVAFGLPFAIFLLRNFFTQVPNELLEASRLDGAGEWRIFSRIVLPLGLPAIASLAIFQFLWTWNDMLVALIFSSPSSQPLTVALQSQLRQFSSNLDILASGSFLSMIVPLIVFFAFQRYFVSALLAGSNR